jgi:hypothetical protein
MSCAFLVAMGEHSAPVRFELPAAPQKANAKSKRDRPILSTLLFHALRCEELCKLKVKDARHAQGRAASQGLRQGRQDAVSAAVSGDQRAPPR